jgi:hypothetical protein
MVEKVNDVNKLDGKSGCAYWMGQRKWNEPVLCDYPFSDVASSKMTYSHTCDMTAASALQEFTYDT